MGIAEATFETGFDTRCCYVTGKHGTATELKDVGLLFFKRYVEETGDIIRMDDGAGYCTSKKTAKWRQRVGLLGLLRMDWPA